MSVKITVTRKLVFFLVPHLSWPLNPPTQASPRPHVVVIRPPQNN